ncbi:DUF2282 domain-containing protein [Legionella brunensis]|nr:DUF2282 domain-containing protein [Legionella brunensis]
MKNMNKVVSAAIRGALAIAAVSATAIPATAVAAPDLEKCYGVAAAGKNDCQTSTHSCAGTATKDRQKDAFILVPKGVCSKIAGGSTTMGQS